MGGFKAIISSSTPVLIDFYADLVCAMPNDAAHFKRGQTAMPPKWRSAGQPTHTNYQAIFVIVSLDPSQSEGQGGQFLFSQQKNL